MSFLMGEAETATAASRKPNRGLISAAISISSQPKLVAANFT